MTRPERTARSWLHGARLLGVLVTSMVILAMSALPVEALGWTQTAHPIVSHCARGITWRGGSAWGYYDVTNYGSDGSYLADLPHGTMDLCYYTYYGDKTVDGDYYLAEVEVTITPAASTYHYDWPATTAAWASSDVTPKDGIRTWTPSYTSKKSCSQAVTVTATVGVLSASTLIQACQTFGTVTVGQSNGKGAEWYTNTSGEVRLLQALYVEKVAHGASPNFNIQFAVPYYTYTNRGIEDSCTTWFYNCYHWDTGPAWINYAYLVK